LNGVQKTNTLIRLCLRGFLYDSINAAVGAKSQRVIVPCQFKFTQSLFGVRQRKPATPRAKMQFGILRINRGGSFVFLQRAWKIAGRFKQNAILIKAVPFGLLDTVQRGRMQRSKGSTVLQIAP